VPETPLGELTALPRPLAGFLRLLLMGVKGKEGEGRIGGRGEFATVSFNRGDWREIDAYVAQS